MFKTIQPATFAAVLWRFRSRSVFVYPKLIELDNEDVVLEADGSITTGINLLKL